MGGQKGKEEVKKVRTVCGADGALSSLKLLPGEGATGFKISLIKESISTEEGAKRGRCIATAPRQRRTVLQDQGPPRASNPAVAAKEVPAPKPSIKMAGV